MIDSFPTSATQGSWGLVTKAISNFCEVLLEGETLRCQFRGKLRMSGGAVLTGDRVEVRRLSEGEGLITRVLSRRTELIRPPVANVDTCIVVMTTQSPLLNLELVDRIMVLACTAGLEILICLNKMDLARDDEIVAVRQTYQATGWPLVMTSAIHGTNVDCFAAMLKDRVAVLSGQSGVGKSTLLNAICPGLELEMGDLSPRAQRGRHTTRAVALLHIAGGWIADAPGFVRMDLPEIEPGRLADVYPEMTSLTGACRFADCVHDAEPGCAVKTAVADGDIDNGRYQRYVGFLHELQARPRY